MRQLLFTLTALGLLLAPAAPTSPSRLLGQIVACAALKGEKDGTSSTTTYHCHRARKP